ncbi:ZRANB3 [Bugula neritina]|uniref:ZRANB3 n=1 Tax=Bugula neritina TaxID=10212 RepID=A0A7J7KR52_BUGNE|nr:ZRANB3 [Bugula neritina]
MAFLSKLQSVVGSDLSGDLFSDASFEDEMFDDSPQHQTQGLSTVDKAEEAKLAAELLCDDEVEDEENGEYWTCICRAVNDRELDCCLKCKLPRMPTTWTCRSCLTLNRLADTHCDECLAERDTGADDPGEGERVVDISAIPVYPKFYFLVSHHTTRIFIHDQDKNYLQSSFHTVDLDNPDLLPDILLHPANHKLAKDFVCKWNSLKKREQKVLIKKKEPIDCPEKAYFGGKLTKLRTSNRQRYKSKADIAEEAHRLVESNPGAQTRVIQRPVRDRAANVNESNIDRVLAMCR